MKIICTLLAALSLGSVAFAQDLLPASAPKSIHQLESEAQLRVFAVPLPESTGLAMASGLAKRSFAGKKVFGYHPYWSGATAHTTYDYAALTVIGYFSYEVDTATGGYTTLHGWLSTPVTAYAHQRGVKVALTVTNFGAGQNDRILGDPVRRTRLADSLVAVIRRGGGDGVNIDFEDVGAKQRANLVAFMGDLAAKLHAAIPGAEVSMATPAVDWSGAFDLAQLSRICDYLIVMGYDYYWSGSTQAGPVAPLSGGTYNVTNTVNTYLSAGVSPGRLLLGVPWYGYDWPVRDSARMSRTTGAAAAVVYSATQANAKTYGTRFDARYGVPWYGYYAAAWHQAWYDDSASLGMKYALVGAKGLGGIGIWALGYEGGRKEVWDGIKTAFGASSVDGGPGSPVRTRQSLTIAPNPASAAATLRFGLGRRSAVALEMVDGLGREAGAAMRGTFEPGEYQVPLDLSGLPDGLYLCRLTVDGSSASRYVVVAK